MTPQWHKNGIAGFSDVWESEGLYFIVELLK